MQVKTICKTYGRKISHDYQTWEFNGIAEAILTEGEDPIAAADNLFGMVRDSVMRDVEKEIERSKQFRLAVEYLRTRTDARIQALDQSYPSGK